MRKFNFPKKIKDVKLVLVNVYEYTGEWEGGLVFTIKTMEEIFIADNDFKPEKSIIYRGKTWFPKHLLIDQWRESKGILDLSYSI